MLKRYFSLLYLAFTLLPSSLFAQAMKQCLHVYTQNKYIHIAKIDLSCSNIEFIGSQLDDQGTSVSQFAQKYQTDIAINANFYWKDFTPIGLVVTDYKKISKYSDVRSRAVFACDRHNRCSIEPKNQVAKLDPKWKTAISGWHTYNPKTISFECATSDKIGCVQDIFTGKHPRTLLGLDTTRNLLYLVVVEGRQFAFRGMTLDELALLAHSLELTQGINLDGGGSSTFVVENKRLSALPFLQSEERKVSNHFGVKIKH